MSQICLHLCGGTSFSLHSGWVNEGRDTRKLQEIENTLTGLIRLMVDHADVVVVSVTSGDLGIVLAVCVSQKDVRKVIGKGGRTATSLGILLSAIGMKLRTKILLNISTTRFQSGVKTQVEDSARESPKRPIVGARIVYSVEDRSNFERT